MNNIDLTRLVTAEGKQAAAYASIIASHTAAIQMHLDATAQQRQYDGIQTAVSYRDDPNPQFAAEAEALFVWRSAVWTYANAELENVQSGARIHPGIDELIGELPELVWP